MGLADESDRHELFVGLLFGGCYRCFCVDEGGALGLAEELAGGSAFLGAGVCHR